MPKKLKVSPNQRVDIPDFLRGVNDYTAETAAAHAQKVLLGDRGYVLQGFRVQIINDPGNPAKVIVFNGNSFNPDGTRLHNEADPAYAQEVSLTGAGNTFSVEIVFEEDDSDEDARAFWDPTIDNVSPIPDGREFNATVVTRITPTWRIVRPVSTTGFDFNALSNPDSLKIPLVQLITDGTNQIFSIDNPGLTTDFPATVIEDDYDPAGSNSMIKVADATLFSDSTDNAITVDPDGVTPTGTEPAVVSTVDRANNILTLSGPLSGDYPAGTVVQATGRTQEYIVQRTDGLVPVDATTTPDHTARLWQGNEIRGSGLAVSKEDATARDDLNIRTLKDAIDFLAANQREMRWGSLRSDESGIEDGRIPPTSFTAAATRYFDKSGSIEGSRTYTFSVGDGINSFGDFNGTDETPFNKAIENAPAGATIFVKQGTYTLSNKIVVDTDINFVGEGNGIAQNSPVIIITSATDPVFELAEEGADFVRFKDIGIGQLGTHDIAVECTKDTMIELEFDHCTVTGAVQTSPTSLTKFRIKDSVMSHTATGGIALGSGTTNFATVEITGSTLNTSALNGTGLFVANNITSLMLFAHNTVTTGNNTGIALLGACTAVRLEHNEWTYTETNCAPIVASVGTLENFSVDTMHIQGTSIHTSVAAFSLASFRQAEIKHVFVQDEMSTGVLGTMTFIRVNTTEDPVTGRPNVLVVDDCTVPFTDSFGGVFLQCGSGTQSTDVDVTIQNCQVTKATNGVTMVSPGLLRIDGCTFNGVDNTTTATNGIFVGEQSGNSELELDVRISNSVFQNIQNPAATELAGIRIDTGVLDTNDITNLFVDNCVIESIGDPASVNHTIVHGIYMDDGVEYEHIHIHDNKIRDIEGGTTGAATGIGILAANANTIAGAGQQREDSIHIHDNTISGVGTATASGSAIGIELQPTSADVQVDGIMQLVHIHDNTIGNLRGFGTANFGITCVASVSIDSLNIHDNILAYYDQSATTFGAFVNVQTVDAATVAINNNQIPIALAGNGDTVATGISFLITSSSGSARDISITGNQMRAPDTAGSGSISGILVNAASGATVTHLDILHNIIEVKGTLGPGTAIAVTGFDGTHVNVSHNTITESTFNINRGAINITAATLLEYVTIAFNSVFGQLGTRTVFGVTVFDVDFFTVANNIIDWSNGGNTGGAGSRQLRIEGNHGTVTGNVINDNQGTAIDFSNCVKVLATGNVVDSSGSIVTTGSSDSVFEFGDDTAVIATGPLNLIGAT